MPKFPLALTHCRSTLVLLLAIALGATTVRAQLVEDVPSEVADVGVEQMLGAQVPLDLKFTDDHGQPITLGQVFSGQRPVLLSLNYSNCPQLCQLQLNGLIDGIELMPWKLGTEFDLVSVSIDPREPWQRAQQTKQRYLRAYGRPGVKDGMRFLVGTQASIEQLAKAVGFKYQFIAETGEFSHPPVMMVCSPDGKISQYLGGVLFDPNTVRLALTEAADGKVGSLIDQVFLFACYSYDHTKGRYGPSARKLMSVGAGTTVVVIALGLVPYWFSRRHPEVVDGEATPPTASS